MENTRPFQRSEETQETLDFLKKITVGASFTYQELNDAVHYEISRKPHHLQSAIEIALGEGVYFKNNPSKGYKRISQNEAALEVRQLNTKKIKSVASRTKKRLKGIDPSRLGEKELAEYSAALIELKLTEALTSKKTQQLIDAHISNQPAQSSIDKKESQKVLSAMLAAGWKG